MKRVLYWIGLLMLVGVALMPDVLIPPLASAGHVLAQDSTQQTPSEQQYLPDYTEVTDFTEADLISKGCTPEGMAGEDDLRRPGYSEGMKLYHCPTPDSTMDVSCHGICEMGVHPDGTVIKLWCACPAIAKQPEDRQGGSDGQGTPKHPARHCQPADELPNGTKVSICGDNILFEYPDGTTAWASPVQTQQGGGQQGADQRSDSQQQDGDQQQGASRQGYGCALLE